MHRRPPAVPPGGRWPALVALFHPLPSLATVLAALGFAALFGAGRRPPRAARRLAWLALMMASQQAAISLHNDWCDRHLDARAKPWRAIPRGLVRPEAVRSAAWALAALSLVAAAPLGGRLVLLDAAGTGAGLLYNAGLKGTPWSWLPFATAFPLLPLFGATAAGVWPQRWWTLYLVGAPAAVAIHLADTLPDLPADTRAGIGGLAHRLGAQPARRLCLATAGLATLIGGGAGLALAERTAVAGAVSGAALTILAARRPGWERPAISAGTLAAGLGWVAAVARRT